MSSFFLGKSIIKFVVNVFFGVVGVVADIVFFGVAAVAAAAV